MPLYLRFAIVLAALSLVAFGISQSSAAQGQSAAATATIAHQYAI